MVLILGLVAFNAVGGFLVNLSSATFPADLVFAVVSGGVWILLKDHTFFQEIRAPVIQGGSGSFQGWSAVSRLEFSDEESEVVPEPLSPGFYRYRVQFIAWPPTVGTCAAADLDLFLSHLRKRQGEKVLVLTQLDPRVAAAEAAALASKHGIVLIPDMDLRIDRESLPDAADFHRVLVFGPVKKRVRWEIAAHRVFEKRASLPQKVASEIQV